MQISRLTKEEGISKLREITCRQAINEALHEEMSRDDTVFILGEDVCRDLWETHGGLVDRFGMERIRDTAISEAAIVGAAVGAALAGYRPIADIMYADFLFCAADETLNQAATFRFSNGGIAKVPMVIKAAIGGYSGGGPMHSQCTEAFLWHRPGLKIALPSTPYDAKGLLKTAIRDNNPVVYLFHKLLLDIKGEVPAGEYTIPLGMADIKRKGDDVTIVATAYMVKMALDVANQLQDRGISIEVVDIRTLEPLDIDTIVTSVKKTRRVVVVDEDVSRCGVTSEICMQIMEKAFDSLVSPIQRVAASNLPIPSGFLEQYVLPQPQDIANAVGAALGTKERLSLTIETPKPGFKVY
jgi:pyruvate/2-oxoglutarate/acetoin dehydrogenase E1 component